MTSLMFHISESSGSKATFHHPT